MVLRGLREIDEHLDSKVSQYYKDQPLAQDWARVAKALEEAGEAIAALIGYTGQNPRKGFTHGKEDLLDELADLALTGIYAIQHFTKDEDTTYRIIEVRMKKHMDRVGINV
jgi:hypothetical protein